MQEAPLTFVVVDLVDFTLPTALATEEVLAPETFLIPCEMDLEKTQRK